MNKMQNPHTLTASRMPEYDDHFGANKRYAPVVGWPMRKTRFKRASQAQTYAERVHARWCRLYDAAITEMSQEPSA